MTYLSRKLQLLGVCALAFAALLGGKPAYAALDTSIGINGIVSAGFGEQSFGSDIVVQADGKIVAIGGAGDDDDDSTPFAVVRYNADGSLDTGFSGDGKQTSSFGSNVFAFPLAMELQEDQKIVVSGIAYQWVSTFVVRSYFAVARYKTNGALDTSFSGDGILTTSFGGNELAEGSNLAIQGDGKIVVVGRGAANTNFATARYNTDGSLDTTFSIDGKQTTSLNFSGDMDRSYATGVVIGEDGTITVSGNAGGGKYSSPYFAVVRYESDGTLDADFSGDGKQVTAMGSVGDQAFAADLALQDDGKLVIAGAAQDGSSGGLVVLVRYDNDGALDATFSADGKQEVYATPNRGEDGGQGVALQSDGKIVVVGLSSFPSEDSEASLAVLRFLNDGMLDTTFSADGRQTLIANYGSNEGFGIALDAGENILIAGSYTPNNASFDAQMIIARYLGGDEAPASTVLPTISGAAEYGETLTCNPGEWSGDPVLTFSWYRNQLKIATATTSTKLLSLSDAGQKITCRIYADGGLWIDQEITAQEMIPKAEVTLRNVNSKVTRFTCANKLAVKGWCYRITATAQLVTSELLAPASSVPISIWRVNASGVAVRMSTSSTTPTGKFLFYQNFKPPETNTLLWVRNYFKRTRFNAIATSRTTGTTTTVVATMFP